MKSLKNARMTQADADGIRQRAAEWRGPSAAFVHAEADRFEVGIETIRRVLRNETYRVSKRPAEGAQPSGLAAQRPAVSLPPGFSTAGSSGAVASAARLAALAGEPSEADAALAKFEAAVRSEVAKGPDAIVDELGKMA